MAKKFESEIAAASTELEFNMPIAVVIGEASDTSIFLRKHFEPITKGPDKRPGLSSSKGRVNLAMADDIDVLVLMSIKANGETVMATGEKKGARTLERGRLVVNELVTILDWHVDGGASDGTGAKLVALKTKHRDERDTHDGLALQLHEYAALAEPLRDDIDGVIGFDAKLIDEAPNLAAELLALPPENEDRAARMALVDRRNQIINVMYARVNLIRATARAVFRHHPEIARMASSAYMRTMRADARRAEKAAPASPVTTAPASPTPSAPVVVPPV